MTCAVSSRRSWLAIPWRSTLAEPVSGLFPYKEERLPMRCSSKLPDQAVLFVGDFIMPYLGAPFVEEGNLQGLFEAIDIIVEKQPKYLLHGHEPLTRNFTSPTMLAQ